MTLHIEPPRGWLNDPNGLCFHGGRYHAYFQYCPDDASGAGKKCWGHCVSDDLTRWSFDGIAIYPDTPFDRDGAYSGCAVSDEEGIRLFYTGNVKREGNFDYVLEGRDANVLTAFSADGLKFGEKQLLLTNSDYPDYCSRHVRDPMLFDGGKRMVLGARSVDAIGMILIYGGDASDVNSRWSFERSVSSDERFGYMWECPDIFTVGGKRLLSVSPQGILRPETGETPVSRSGYFPFPEGARSVCSEAFHEWDVGFDFYAPQTFEAPDGRRILVGWMGLPDSPYERSAGLAPTKQLLTLPREVTLEEGIVKTRPARELEGRFRDEKRRLDGESFTLDYPSALFIEPDGDFALDFDAGLRIGLCGGRLCFEFDGGGGGCGKGRGSRVIEVGEAREIELIADEISLELFVNGGETAFTTRYFPENRRVTLHGAGARVFRISI